MTVSLQNDSRSPYLAFAGIKQESYLPVGAADSVGRPAALNCGGREISKLPNETKHRDNKAHLLTFGRFGCEGAFFRFVTSSNKV